MLTWFDSFFRVMKSYIFVDWVCDWLICCCFYAREHISLLIHHSKERPDNRIVKYSKQHLGYPYSVDRALLMCFIEMAFIICIYIYIGHGYSIWLHIRFVKYFSSGRALNYCYLIHIVKISIIVFSRNRLVFNTIYTSNASKI